MDVTAGNSVHDGRRVDVAPSPVLSVPVAARSRWFWLRVALAVALRPTLWLAALRIGLRACPAGWWRHAPYLPRPDRDYLRFRFETAYGSRGAPRVHEVVGYLRWCRER
jgi:hypothetical protein